MNSTSSISLFCLDMSRIMNVYLGPVKNLTGIILSILNSISFYYLMKKQKKTQGFLYKYLFIRSIDETILFIANSFSIFYFCLSKCSSSTSYIMQIWKIYFYFYVSFVTIMYSTFLDILASIDRFFLINSLFKKFNFYKSKYYYFILTPLLGFFCVVFYINRIFEYEIVPIVNSTNMYKIQFTDYYFLDKTSQNLRLLNVFMRDFISTVLIMLLNILILFSLKKSLSNKKLIFPNFKSSTKERQVTFMVLLNGLKFLIGHTPIFIYYLDIEPLAKITCFYDFSRFMIIFSYWIGFFIYYIFNRQFRKSFNSIIFF